MIHKILVLVLLTVSATLFAQNTEKDKINDVLECKPSNSSN